MMPKVIEAPQGSMEWQEARLGKATASRFADILATTKSGTEGAGRKNYRAELVIERLMKRVAERGFKSPAMEYGSEIEALACVQYELATGNLVDECGFFLHPELEAGASPDGLIGEDGQIEIKSPNTATHIETLKSGEIPSKYIPQVEGQLLMTGRAWCDFVSYEGEFPPNAQLFIKRHYRNEEKIRQLEKEIARFLGEVEAEVEFVRGYSR